MRRGIAYISIILIVLICGCAQQGAPTGGPKDEKPPILLKAEPENYTINFRAKKILLTFDEFLDMGNFTQELVVSPPMDEKPEIKLRNKTLIIEFEEELKEDITYTFNFGEGIKDLNERNVLMNFEYVFSTGDYLDSLSVKGRLKKAFDLTIPETPISVMLYTELNDSLPLLQIPYYVGRADKEGNFAVNNLKPNVYKLFVLKDGNNNFLFDLPTEEIAFLDSSLLVDAAFFKTVLMESGKYDSADFVRDTIPLAIDTTGLSADTIAMKLDSLQRAKPDLNSIFVDLFMFTEDPVNQFITDYSRKDRKKLQMIFNLPLSEEFSYTPLYPETLRLEDFITDFGVTRDTLQLWVADTTIGAIDTINLKLSYLVKDSLGVDVLKNDTISLVYKEPTKKEKGTKKKEPDNELFNLTVNTIRNNGRQNLNKQLIFSTDVPIGQIDSSRFSFFIIPDTTEVALNLFPEMQGNSLYRAEIDLEWPEETAYRMVLYPGAIKDIYGETHDTMDIKFKTRIVSDYGKIILNVTNVHDSVLIQLMSKDKVLRKRSISTDGNFVFEYVEPATYRIKFVYDRNLNKRWDTGKYLENSQPEKVEFLPKDIAVRANWDHDADYEMGSNDTFPAAEKKAESKTDTNRNQPSNNSNMRQGDTFPAGNIPSSSPSRSPQGVDNSRLRR